MAQDEKMKPGEKKQPEPGEKEDGEKPDEKTGDPKNPGETRNDQVADGTPPKSEVGKLLQKIMGTAQWGNLPKKLREEMGNAAGKEFPREYREIISKYYKRMAEVMQK